MKKRQEIGRGLRLPVDQNGDRVFDVNINKLTVIANESYEDFAKALQREYEEDCGVTFGKVPRLAFSHISRITNGEENILGREASEQIWATLEQNGYVDEKGRILSTFNPRAEGFSLGLSEEVKDIEDEVIAILQSYQLERHIKKDEEPRKLQINKQVFLDPEFEQLWEKINKKTTYRVEYSTEELIKNCVKSIQKMEKIQPVKIAYREALVDVQLKGITTQETRSNYERISHVGNLPDIILYLQNQTELTRRTIVEILTTSNRLEEFAINPQKYMDEVAHIINHELHKLMIDGIKYEKVTSENTEWSMELFKDEEVLSYLNNRLEVNHSVYDAVVYDSEVERKFAEQLDKREDVRLFVKLPAWFKIETPIGTYNPDWAIVKHEDETIYLVRETKGTKDFEKLRNSEADKIRCGRKHFDALGVNFAVTTNVSDIL